MIILADRNRSSLQNHNDWNIEETHDYCEVVYHNDWNIEETHDYCEVILLSMTFPYPHVLAY
jgi:hypothetical protein